MSNDDANRLVWVDLEMSGLDVNKCRILEMACLITDSNLNVIAQGPELIIHQAEDVLASMDEWCTEHHAKSGLTQAVRDSKVSIVDAEDMMLRFVEEHTPCGKCPLAGNTVHMDKRFLDAYMPRFSEHLHYRIVDVSTVKEICRRWFPMTIDLAPSKVANHRALDDIKESIEELKFYRKNIFKESLELSDS
ncbi:hypothetical protein CAPTEDRAFT_221441 [Capitella teleta]|uniref:Exonuclease domain-containing protein n=1 Tax=Capitella teleta TaxID=283909 RepID=R7U1D1_CAPTE|nr:hypothetical protein CAPTEDRAFT_221441 [Capitella teleta]|eukprot:ELT97456.1 hypothetical protein CAPTEDRAFT_221441 [Capitella teleta]